MEIQCLSDDEDVVATSYLRRACAMVSSAALRRRDVVATPYLSHCICLVVSSRLFLAPAACGLGGHLPGLLAHCPSWCAQCAHFCSQASSSPQLLWLACLVASLPLWCAVVSVILRTFVLIDYRNLASRSFFSSITLHPFHTICKCSCIGGCPILSWRCVEDGLRPSSWLHFRPGMPRSRGYGGESPS